MRTVPVRLWLCVEPTDLRCSYDGLAARVHRHLGHNPLSGEGFTFLNRRRTQMKALCMDRGGYVIWMKRLERGRFAGPVSGLAHKAVGLSETEFAALSGPRRAGAMITGCHGCKAPNCGPASRINLKIWLPAS